MSRRSLLRLPTPRAEPNFEALTATICAAWQRDGHAPLLRQLEPAAGVLAPLLELRSGHRVLDVGAGDGNIALAAAGEGATVWACDLAPRMVELGRARTAAAGHAVDWQQADVQALPYPDASFDSVASAFGANLAPNVPRAACELVRVTRPGGKVAIASWVPRGLPGRVDELVDAVAPRPPGVPRPSDWGVEAIVRRRLGPLLEGLEVRTRTLTLSFASAEEAFVALTLAYPPAEARRAALRPAFDRVLASCNNLPPSVQIDARYLVAVGILPE